jgi:hypothetical protein
VWGAAVRILPSWWEAAKSKTPDPFDLGAGASFLIESFLWLK